MKPFYGVLLALLVLSGCTVNRAGLAPMPGGILSATPALACPGDTVIVRWDTQRPAQPSFCAYPNGNTPTLQSCRASTDCAATGGSCVDGYCNRCAAISDAAERRSECAVPSNRGCQPDLFARLRVTPPPSPALVAVDEISEHSGERSFVVQQSSAIAFRSEVADAEGNRAGRSDWLGRIDLDAQVEVVDPALVRTAPNAYECRGNASWPGVFLETLFPRASDRLRVLQVRNPNDFTVVGSIDGTPLRLAPGATQALGLLPRGVLQAQPDADYLRTLPSVQCSATVSRGAYPAAPLELTLGCAAP